MLSTQIIKLNYEKQMFMITIISSIIHQIGLQIQLRDSKLYFCYNSINEIGVRNLGF
jgi:hypothetical protein